MKGKIVAYHINLYSGELTEHALDLDDLFDLREERLDEKLKEQPGLLAWMGVLLASAETLKSQAERAEKEIIRRYYLQFKMNGEAKSTDKLIMLKIEGQKLVKGAKDLTEQRTQQHTTLKALYESVKELGRMIQTLCANIRHERFGKEGRDSH